MGTIAVTDVRTLTLSDYTVNLTAGQTLALTIGSDTYTVTVGTGKTLKGKINLQVVEAVV